MYGEITNTEGYLERLVESCEDELEKLPKFSPQALEYRVALQYYNWKLNRTRQAAEE